MIDYSSASNVRRNRFVVNWDRLMQLTPIELMEVGELHPAQALHTLLIRRQATQLTKQRADGP